MALTGDISGSFGKSSIIGVTGSIDLTYDGEGTEDGWIQLREMSTNPGAPGSNQGKLFVKDNGSGTTLPYFIDAAGNVSSLISAGGSTSPAGSDGNVQYNNGGSFGGAARLVYDDTNIRVGIGSTSPTQTLHVYASTSSNYVAMIDNDESSSAHGLKVTTDGNGSGTYVFDAESGSDTLFRIRGDGRVGIGKVSSLAAVLTVSSSNSVSDIAIAHKIQHVGDSDTSISFDSDEITFEAGGTASMQVTDGAIHVAQYIKHIGDTNTLINFTDDKIILKAGNKAMVTMEEKGSAPHEVTINDGGNNIDFVVKGNGSNAGNPGVMFDASTNKLGINGVGTPDYELDVAGNIGLNEYIYHNGDDNTYIRFQDDDINLQAGGRSMIKISEGSIDQVLVMSGGSGLSPNVKSSTDTNFFVSGTIGSIGTSGGGTSVFGGDLVTSGTLSARNNLIVEDHDANDEGTITLGDLGGSVYSTATTNQYGRLTVQTRNTGRDGEIWLDSADDIILDVHTGGTLEMRENSTSVLKITPNSSNVVIQPQVANKDLILSSQSGNTIMTVDSSDESLKINRRLGLGGAMISSTGTLSADAPFVMIANGGGSDITGTLATAAFSGQIKVIVGMQMSSGACILSYTNAVGGTTTKTLTNGVAVMLCSFDATGSGAYRWFPVGDVS